CSPLLILGRDAGLFYRASWGPSRKPHAQWCWPVCLSGIFGSAFTHESGSEVRKSVNVSPEITLTVSSVQAFFINLDSRADRRAFIEAQLARVGLQADRLSAVSPATLTISPINTGHPEMAVRGAMTQSELACLESHAKLWSRAASTEDLTLILEDDVVLSNHVAAFLATLRPDPTWDVLRLETNFHTVRLSGDVTVINGVEARRLMQPQSGAGAYVLTPKAAQAYLSSRHLWGVPADTMVLSPPHAYQLRVFQLLPALSTHLEQLNGQEPNTVAVSEIGKTRKVIVERANIRSNRLTRLLRQVASVLGLLRWFSPSAVLRSRRMHVPFDPS
ncbi:MAG: glycosyltransferase family 25 protein, partial [Verrucomicrobiaceae bacterium]